MNYLRSVPLVSMLPTNVESLGGAPFERMTKQSPAGEKLDQGPNITDQDREIFSAIKGKAKDIFYYILHERGGSAEFRDLIGHTDSCNEILKHLGRDRIGISEYGFGITKASVEVFRLLFKREMDEGKYAAPKFRRTPM